MTLFFAALSFLSLLIWLYLIALRGRFWLADQQLEEDLEEPESWPAVVALVPARNEAEVIEHSLEGLLRQDYPGPFHVIATARRAWPAPWPRSWAARSASPWRGPASCRPAGRARSGRWPPAGRRRSESCRRRAISG
jgi:cellulose synthase/poly-beta-1,6-N-acetylglucosamine synthase-like glycosyltransferase